MNRFRAVTQKGARFHSKVRYFGLSAAAAMCGVGAFLALSPGKAEEPLFNRSLTGAIISATITWTAWVLTVRPQVELSEKAIIVRNWVTETAIPYGHIARVGVSDGLAFELADGSTIRGRVVSASLVGQLAGYPSAKLIRREISPFLRGEHHDENASVRQTFSLSVKVPLTVLSLHALLYGALRYILHVS